MIKKESYIKSPMNYIGGKGKILSQLLPLFPLNISTFVDLFCGGCNVGINVNAKRIKFNDNITYLIDLYNAFLNLAEENIFQHIYSRIEQFNLSLTNEHGYKEIRSLYNKYREPLDLFVLMAYGFNHQIRFNSAHKFNIPFGKKRSTYNNNMEENLKRFLKKLHTQKVEFTCFNFDQFDLSKVDKEDFVYCDPPYLITTGTYNDGKRGFTGWNENEEKKLLSILDNLNEKNIRFALSNVLTHKDKSNDILINWIESKKYHIIHLNKNYSNSNYQTKNRNPLSTDEVVILNYVPNKL